ncbi:MAG: hypothetical protein PHX13_01020 [Thiovulaceae bacterium]|nr:hypothetical protein [Sulfurimonadaceae bacterium]
MFLIDPSKGKLVRLREIIKPTNTFKYTYLDLDEWAYVFEYQQYTLLLTCKAIYHYFYAPWKIFDKAAKSGSLSLLYLSTSKGQNGDIRIDFEINTKLNYKSILHLGKILSSSIYSNGFYYHYFQTAVNKSNKPIKSILPTLSPFYVTLGVEELNDSLLIANVIGQENIKYPLETLLFRFPSHQSRIDEGYQELELDNVQRYFSFVHENFYYAILLKLEKEFDVARCNYRNSTVGYDFSFLGINVIDGMDFHSYSFKVEHSSIEDFQRCFLIITIQHPSIKENVWIFRSRHFSNGNEFMNYYAPLIMKFFFEHAMSYKKLKKFVYDEFNYIFYKFAISSFYMMFRGKETIQWYENFKKFVFSDVNTQS